MGFIFGRPKAPDIDMPVSEPLAIPEVGKEKPKKRKRGRRETIITGELEPVTTKKTLLGGIKYE